MKRSATLFLRRSFAAALMAGCSAAAAQQPEPAAPAGIAAQPRVFDPGLGSAESGLPPRSIRFVTTDDFPPFNFTDGNGALIGYNIELARTLCRRATVACTIQALPFAELDEALRENRADAIIAGLRPRGDGDLLFTRPYLVVPSRFAARSDARFSATPEGLAGRKVAAVEGSRQAAYLKDFFGETTVEPAADLAAALGKLKGGEVDAVFADALALAFWLNGPAAAGCCGFVGGAYTEPAYFDARLAIAVPAEDVALKRFLDGALARMEQAGELDALYFTFFPAGLY